MKILFVFFMVAIAGLLAGLLAFGQLTFVSSASSSVLWIGNDGNAASVFKTDTTGTILTEIPLTPNSGIAFDGAFLYFSNIDGSITKRADDGATVIDSFSIPLTGSPAEDLAWDTKRLRLWRIEHNPPAVVKINPTTKTQEATYPIDPADPEIGPRGGIGIAYDKTRDVLYVSLCQQGCSGLEKGQVLIMNPDTGAITGELFRTVGFRTGGLGYDPATDTLWVGGNSPIRNMSLGGAVLSSFAAPSGFFLDGLEFLTPLGFGLVPCGGEGQPACTLCHVFQLIKNILDIFLFPIVPIVAALLFAIGGFLLFAAAGNPQNLGRAKTIIFATIIGLLIIYGSWLFVGMLLDSLGVLSWTGLGTWWEITC